MSLAQLLSLNRDKVRERLRLGRAHWDVLVEGLGRAERHTDRECYEEQLWTFALACAYAAADGGPSQLAGRLAGCPVVSEDIWFEVLPRSPRRAEGQSNLDLALGHLALRAGTESGIELMPGPKRTIVFCEFKWYSDIAYAVSFAQHRNQLARVIENALLFRATDGGFAEQVHVCLVTPQVFRDRSSPSRLYQYKWHDYTEPGHERLLADLRDCGLELEMDLPEPRERLEGLRLAWRSYEELAFSAPESAIREAFKRFYESCRGSELLKWEAR